MSEWRFWGVRIAVAIPVAAAAALGAWALGCSAAIVAFNATAIGINAGNLAGIMDERRQRRLAEKSEAKP